MKIFDNGYLLPEFINPNYRGLVGWPIKRTYEGSGSTFDNLLIAINNVDELTDDGFIEAGDKYLIPQFTPKDIPVGELVWVGRIQMKIDLTKGDYIDRSHIKWSLEVHNPISNVTNKDYIVPYLIAETAEDAERLKNWSSDE